VNRSGQITTTSFLAPNCAAPHSALCFSAMPLATTAGRRRDGVRSTFGRAVELLLLVLLSPLLLLALIPYLLYTAALYCAVWLLWCRRGKDILFVWSESPVWKDRIQTRLLPKLGHRAVVLNWSERGKWTERFSLARIAFGHFGGHREFNPLAVVFRPLRRAKTLRFWRPYKQWNQGQPEALERLEVAFLDLLESDTPAEIR
jgi:hypothetical protein